MKNSTKWFIMLTVCVLIVGLVVLIVELTKSPSDDTTPISPIEARYRDAARAIIDFVNAKENRHLPFIWLANLSDTFGPRKIGSAALQAAIDRNVIQFKNEYGFDRVFVDEVNNLPNWTRGDDLVMLEKPYRRQLGILALGSTVGTDGQVLEADATVVTSWDELNRTCDKLKGRIVVYAQPWTNYGDGSKFRSNGASQAQKCGAVGTLIRTAASSSIYSPHTGQQRYAQGVTPIPTVSLAVEDAETLLRMQNNGEQLRISMRINSGNNFDSLVTSYNTIFDLRGAVLPQEAVMISGHFDSWDVGAGTMDNGAGATVALHAILLLHRMIEQKLLPPPKRTIRGILWTAEEEGSLGAQHFYERYLKENNTENATSYVFLQEADEGFFRPIEFGFTGSPQAQSFFQNHIHPLVKELDIAVVHGNLGDSSFWGDEGIPGVMLASAGAGYERYFQYHHSHGDRPTTYQPDELTPPTAAWAVLAYVIADMNETIPLGPTLRYGI